MKESTKPHIEVPKELFEEMHKYLVLYGLLHEIGETEMFNTILKQTEEIMASGDKQPKKVMFFAHFTTKTTNGVFTIRELHDDGSDVVERFSEWLDKLKDFQILTYKQPVTIINCSIIR